MDRKKILHNVLVLKMDDNFNEATALAWTGDKILAVGSREELFQQYPDAEKIDGDGHTVLPGFIDPHIHFLDGILYQGALDCSPSKASGIDALKQLLQKEAMRHEKNQWIVAHGYDPWEYPGKKAPTRYDLDEACPNNPVVIVHYSFHECIANSRALELAHITKDSPQPYAGIIKKDKKGNPTGLLIETAMGEVMHLSKRCLIEQTKKEVMERIAHFQKTLWSFGITRIGDPAIQNSCRALYQEAYKAGILATPVFMYPCNDENMLELPMDKLKHPFQWEDNELLKTGPLKFFLDGADRAAMILDARQFLHSVLVTILDSIRTLSLTPIKTALRSPVRLGKDLKFHFGLLMADTTECQHLVSRAIEKDLSIAFHAIGNEATHQAIHIIRQAAQLHTNSPPVRIEHCLFLNNETIRQIKAIGAAVVTQPYFLTHMNRENVPYLPGIKQLPLRSLINEGIRVAGSSDWPVVSCDPLLGIERAVTRITKGNETLQEQEAITVREAFAMYTREAAHVLGCLDETGTLEPGKRTDFILLSGDPIGKKQVRWSDVKVQKTFLGGKMMFPNIPKSVLKKS
jgi:predicted amidohydrolase YtcJ